ncbi:hypothetical protein M422DRAFT_30133 [Sphaerobolus stellatus SS14]|uniref:Unplaced genomic scaffold SPHSTscaffold_38, whole genome shotgun sequence n=1 Tax=Sphaerobolus stellatus (strain SS14) TaxID=990650 RepID=A0A0C9W1A4_SPHS4|nr:hypothetical protein M422DRAFT_30133 [Sphaerobolus stellatus SS14]
MSLRRATHAGSWYTANRNRLDNELTGWLTAVGAEASQEFNPPIKGCKAIVAPHAGYAYSGSTAAWAYKSIDPVGIKRVFVLGPSHHVYMDGCALPTVAEYATPIGNLPLDMATIAELRATGQFTDMSQSTDEDEHSIEMHLPYIRKVFQGYDVALVPILVGAISKEKEVSFGSLLAQYLDKEDTICIVSSDFCHWGTRFQYTFYYPSAPNPNSDDHPVGQRLSRGQALPSTITTFPIYASIEALDREALRLLTLPGPCESASRSHDEFAKYLERTKNTICGRHPIGVLLGALSHLESEGEGGKTSVMKWVRYAQSSQCHNINDSSVSYASAYVIF